MDLWDHLCQVTSLRFVAQSRSDTGWTGVGDGNVAVELQGVDIIIFNESGTWHPIRGRETQFTNVFRWTRIGPKAIRLEHLRFGVDHPVFLFEMEPGKGGAWVPVSPHLCERDCYAAELHLVSDGVDLSWSITGPKKSETIAYEYRWKKSLDNLEPS